MTYYSAVAVPVIPPFAICFNPQPFSKVSVKLTSCSCLTVEKWQFVKFPKAYDLVIKPQNLG